MTRLSRLRPSRIRIHHLRFEDFTLTIKSQVYSLKEPCQIRNHNVPVSFALCRPMLSKSPDSCQVEANNESWKFGFRSCKRPDWSICTRHRYHWKLKSDPSFFSSPPRFVRFRASCYSPWFDFDVILDLQSWLGQHQLLDLERIHWVQNRNYKRIASNFDTHYSSSLHGRDENSWLQALQLKSIHFLSDHPNAS